jgi:hypothetical protein
LRERSIAQRSGEGTFRELAHAFLRPTDIGPQGLELLANALAASMRTLSEGSDLALDFGMEDLLSRSVASHCHRSHLRTR